MAILYMIHGVQKLKRHATGDLRPMIRDVADDAPLQV